MLDREGQPYVTDFGLAKFLTEQSELTQSGAVVGTPSYMAPEQAAGNARDVTTAADAYRPGAILYALLVARPVFRGDLLTETLQQVQEQEPIGARKLNRIVGRASQCSRLPIEQELFAAEHAPVQILDGLSPLLGAGNAEDFRHPLTFAIRRETTERGEKQFVRELFRR